MEKLTWLHNTIMPWLGWYFLMGFLVFAFVTVMDILKMRLRSFGEFIEDNENATLGLVAVWGAVFVVEVIVASAALIRWLASGLSRIIRRKIRA